MPLYRMANTISYVCTQNNYDWHSCVIYFIPIPQYVYLIFGRVSQMLLNSQRIVDLTSLVVCIKYGLRRQVLILHLTQHYIYLNTTF